MRTFALLPLLFLFLLSTKPSAAQTLLQDLDVDKTSLLSERWDLFPDKEDERFRLEAYKPVYFIAARYSSRPNEQPVSGNDEVAVPAVRELDNIESRFQFSLKAKIATGLISGKGSLWGAYTQVAHLQTFNTERSSPIREINYEPEVIAVYPVNTRLAGLDFKMVGIGYRHTSNGLDLPLSRSWNRLFFHAGFEKHRFSLLLTPWIRMPNRGEENPDIEDFVGRGSFTAIYKGERNTFYVHGHHPFNLNEIDRGGLELNWMFQLSGQLYGHVRGSVGYGETLVDYNYQQSTIGVGVSLVTY